MPRPGKRDGAEALEELSALMPWWLPIALAALIWFAVPPLSTRLVASGRQWESTWHLVAGIGALVVMLAGISGQFLKLQRRRLLAQTNSLAALQALSWRQFEQLCAEAYRQAGYAVEETARGADGGVDLVLQ